MKDFIKSIPNTKPNLKTKPTPAPIPNPNHNGVDNQLNMTRRFVNDLSICRASIGDPPNKVWLNNLQIFLQFHNEKY